MATTAVVAPVSIGLAAKAEEIKANAKPKANFVKFMVSEDDELVNFAARKVDLILAAKRSSTGASEGIMAVLTGDFDVTEDGKIFVFDVGHARGGGAYITIQMNLAKSELAQLRGRK